MAPSCNASGGRQRAKRPFPAGLEEPPDSLHVLETSSQHPPEPKGQPPVVLGHPLRSRQQPEPSNGGPPASLSHPETSRIHTTRCDATQEGANPHSPGSLQQLASPLQQLETSFQQVERALQQVARPVQHNETPAQRPERLRVVAKRARVVAPAPAERLASSRHVANTPAEAPEILAVVSSAPANVAESLREGPESAADRQEAGTGGHAGQAGILRRILDRRASKRAEMDP